MDAVIGVLNAAYDLFGKMAPFLLFGYFFAGILHVFMKPGLIYAHLGGDSFSSVVKAALFGVPLPLCSCAVIPAAHSLRNEGASKGAVLSFLISTPTTGVDSILATYSLLGPFFTFYRVVASLITGIFAGVSANIILKGDPRSDKTTECEKCSSSVNKGSSGIFNRIAKVLSYAYIDLIKDTGLALVFGLLLGGAISFLMPKEFVEAHLGYGILPMLIMLVAGLPMYVCATASIPIAAALMFKGLAPGAAFVFLVAGPATNIVTMSVVAKSMGRKALAIYLSSIVVSSIVMGGILNIFWRDLGINADAFGHLHSEGGLPDWIVLSSVLILSVLIARDLASRVLVYLKTRLQV
jgi:uncharacterized protein